MPWCCQESLQILPRASDTAEEQAPGRGRLSGRPKLQLAPCCFLHSGIFISLIQGSWASLPWFQVEGAFHTQELSQYPFSRLVLLSARQAGHLRKINSEKHLSAPSPSPPSTHSRGKSQPSGHFKTSFLSVTTADQKMFCIV